VVKAEDNREMKTEEQIAKKPPYEKPSHCLICGEGGPVLLYGHWICDHCKNMVHAEALSQKRKVFKEGGGPS
jgi:hypothetical protein